MSVGDRFAYAPASESSRRFGVGTAIGCACVNLMAFIGPWIAVRAPRFLIRDGWIRHSAPLLASTRPVALMSLLAILAVGALTHWWRSISAWSPWTTGSLATVAVVLSAATVRVLLAIVASLFLTVAFVFVIVVGVVAIVLAMVGALS